MSVHKVDYFVIPAKAGIQNVLKRLDSRFHGNDKKRPLRYLWTDSIYLDLYGRWDSESDDLRPSAPFLYNRQSKHGSKMVEALVNYAFIDSQNVNLAIRGQGWVLDFKRFRRYIQDKYQISKAFLFIGYVPQNQDLYTGLQKDGYILVF